MAANNQRGGKPNNKPQPMDGPSENERLSLQARLTEVLKRLASRRAEVEAVLPADVTFDNFYSTVNQALRNNPDLLNATPMSLVNACVKAAYDGNRLDGREAALVTHKVKVSSNPDRYELQAQYFPMVFGLVQQILRGGEVISIEAEVVYEKDSWKITRGTNPEIYHEPNMHEDPGPMLFAYTVATLKSGVKTTAYLRKFQIEDVMKSSRSGWHDKDQKPIGVWARWPRQMWLKTVLRFHRKTLPLGNRQVLDMEQQDLFPDMQKPENPLGLRAPTPRPTREDPAALQHHAGDQPLDFGNRTFEDTREKLPVEQNNAQHGKPAAKAKPQEQQKANDSVEQQLPSGPEEWAKWQFYVEGKVAEAKTLEDLEVVHSENADIQSHAPKQIGDSIAQTYSDRAADIAAGPDDGAAAGEGDSNTAAGDQ